MDAYRYHAFIRYAWADDQPFGAEGRPDQSGSRSPAGRNGWVSTFHDRFRKHLGRAIGRTEEGERIWLDYEQLRGSDALSSTVAKELSNSALLVPILSKSWFASPWCRKEFETFIADHPRPQERLFPVWMEPVERDELDGNDQAQAIWNQLRYLIGYSFWYLDDTEQVRTRWFPFADPTDRDYSDIQQDMARDMAGRRQGHRQVDSPKPHREPATLTPNEQPKPCDPPVPPIEDNHLVMISGGSGDCALVENIAGTLDSCEGLGYVVPLTAQQGRADYKPSELSKDLRENLKLTTAVLMVVSTGPAKQVHEQLREYLKAVAKRRDRTPSLHVCVLGEQQLSFRAPGMQVYKVEPDAIVACACDFVRSLAS